MPHNIEEGPDPTFYKAYMLGSTPAAEAGITDSGEALQSAVMVLGVPQLDQVLAYHVQSAMALEGLVMDRAARQLRQNGSLGPNRVRGNIPGLLCAITPEEQRLYAIAPNTALYEGYAAEVLDLSSGQYNTTIPSGVAPRLTLNAPEGFFTALRTGVIPNEELPDIDTDLWDLHDTATGRTSVHGAAPKDAGGWDTKELYKIVKAGMYADLDGSDLPDSPHEIPKWQKAKKRRLSKVPGAVFGSVRGGLADISLLAGEIRESIVRRDCSSSDALPRDGGWESLHQLEAELFRSQGRAPRVYPEYPKPERRTLRQILQGHPGED